MWLCVPWKMKPQSTQYLQAPVWVDLKLKVILEKHNELDESYSSMSFMYLSLPWLPHPQDLKNDHAYLTGFLQALCKSLHENYLTICLGHSKCSVILVITHFYHANQ